MTNFLTAAKKADIKNNFSYRKRNYLQNFSVTEKYSERFRFQFIPLLLHHYEQIYFNRNERLCLGNHFKQT